MSHARSRTATLLPAGMVGLATGLGVALAGGGPVWAAAAAVGTGAGTLAVHLLACAGKPPGRRRVYVLAAVPLVAGLALAGRGDWFGAALNLGAAGLAAALLVVESAMQR